MYMRWDYISEMRSPAGLFSPPMEYRELRWNDTDRAKPKNSGRDLSQSHFVHHKSQIE
jgi:hypothetical protein